MKKQMMQRVLDEAVERTRLPHIFIPSYNRPDFVSAKILREFPEEVRKRIHIVVRWEQRKAYRKANSEFHVLPIPYDYPINGLASTRQFIFEYAVEHRLPMIIDMDDDITYLTYLFDGHSEKSGQPYSKHSVKADRDADPLLDYKILTLAAHISKGIFQKYPDVVFGNIRRQRMSQHVENSKLKYIINSGPTPRQVTFVNVRGLHKAGINRDMMFDPHGDDIGFCAVILAAGKRMFNIPCLTYDYVSEKCDSVVRTPENSKRLHKLEYDSLQQFPIKDYLRVSFRDEDGDYMWGDIDWRKYHKLCGTAPIKQPWRKPK